MENKYNNKESTFFVKCNIYINGKINSYLKATNDLTIAIANKPLFHTFNDNGREIDIYSCCCGGGGGGGGNKQ